MNFREEVKSIVAESTEIHSYYKKVISILEGMSDRELAAAGRTKSLAGRLAAQFRAFMSGRGKKDTLTKTGKSQKALSGEDLNNELISTQEPDTSIPQGPIAKPGNRTK